jgi:hypothetical protein
MRVLAISRVKDNKMKIKIHNEFTQNRHHFFQIFEQK